MGNPAWPKTAGVALLVGVCIVALSACSAGKAKAASEQAVAKFHAQLDGAQYHDIYGQASPEFQKSGTEAEMNEFFGAIHRKLGTVQKADEQAFYINFGMNGTGVTLTYKTTFTNGPATEQFVWRASEPARLISYRVDSRLLVVK